MSGTTSIDSLPSDPGISSVPSTKCSNGNKRKNVSFDSIPSNLMEILEGCLQLFNKNK